MSGFTQIWSVIFKVQWASILRNVKWFICMFYIAEFKEIRRDQYKPRQKHFFSNSICSVISFIQKCHLFLLIQFINLDNFPLFFFLFILLYLFVIYLVYSKYSLVYQA